MRKNSKNEDKISIAKAFFKCLGFLYGKQEFVVRTLPDKSLIKTYNYNAHGNCSINSNLNSKLAEGFNRIVFTNAASVLAYVYIKICAVKLICIFK